MQEERWLLPAGIEEILPPQAQVMEGLRRDLLDLYRSWGYELVIPPFIDYLESLLTGTGHDLDLQTFKLTDQESGRMLGVRADMTPQVARMDAHHLRREVRPACVIWVRFFIRARMVSPAPAARCRSVPKFTVIRVPRAMSKSSV
jgi:histidyl-tRNA synthetase